MAIYTIFAGVNGAGKTYIYRSIYYVIMNYIGVDNCDIAKERVKIRVMKGGHLYAKASIFA
ncbi:hypothetical protein [Clostridium luticellarii]|jgi:predicted ABC-type ATPase|uniref:Uncharacterized protein n=1 Tax=Clostridium luticellarii TaxID=1691940 RepID=A0A2T0BR06_9CLOT|nr:hypothetical protein [Clostridium luticellarii]PRR86303.1 hypothetical protein CLLU_06190 [Clostridium luticellarii]